MLRRPPRQSIEERILHWKPIVFERVANGWRATRLTRGGFVSATAATAQDARMALVDLRGGA